MTLGYRVRKKNALCKYFLYLIIPNEFYKLGLIIDIIFFIILYNML